MSMTQVGAVVTTGGNGTDLDPASLAELSQAMERLEDGGGLVVRLADVVGGAMGRGMRFGTRSLGIVPGAQAAVQSVVEVALKRAFDIAVLRLGKQGQVEQSKRLAGPLVFLSGAVGGFIGMGGFVPDAAVTSLTIMREIARIAVEEGEDLSDPDARAACLQVFALNAGQKGSAEPEASYFSARFVMQGRPVAMLLADVARRFGVTLSQKFAMQAVPVLGAVAGASLNASFLGHYRDLARAHFTIRRLERRFGEAAVRQAAEA
jgi:hypothetical protein